MTGIEILAILTVCIGLTILSTRKVESKRWRLAAFLLNLSSNVLWAVAGVESGLVSTLVVQALFGAINIKGIWTNRPGGVDDLGVQ